MGFGEMQYHGVGNAFGGIGNPMPAWETKKQRGKSMKEHGKRNRGRGIRWNPAREMHFRRWMGRIVPNPTLGARFWRGKSQSRAGKQNRRGKSWKRAF